MGLTSEDLEVARATPLAPTCRGLQHSWTVSQVVRAVLPVQANVRAAVANVQIVDLHTHLFPPSQCAQTHTRPCLPFALSVLQIVLCCRVAAES